MIVRAASPLYSGAGCMARLSYLTSWGSGMRCAITARSYRSGVVDESDLPAPGFSNELATIHEYLTQHVLSRLSSVGEHAPVSLPTSHVFH